MSDGHIQFRVSSEQGGREWRALAAKLRAAKATELRKNLRRTVVDAGKPILADVQSAVRNLQVSAGHGGGAAQRRAHNASRSKSEKAKARALRRGGGLRQTVASATKMQVIARGVRFYVDSKRLPVDQRTLPARLDSQKGWRHPVFGNRSQWVDQKGGPWFVETLKKKAPQFRSAVVQAMEDTKKALEQ
jgi:hypothetical protein